MRSTSIIAIVLVLIAAGCGIRRQEPLAPPGSVTSTEDPSATDTGVQVSSSATTNADTGAILTTETFTRGGNTNLVRVTKVQTGSIVFRLHRFCHNGEPVALFSFRDGVQSFSTVPKSPYQVVVDFLPSKEVRCVMIFGRNFIDGFYPTNGVYYPAPDSDLEIKNYNK
jgi:hypothetical protein